MQESAQIYFDRPRRDDYFSFAAAAVLAAVFHVALIGALPAKWSFKSEKPTEMALEILPPEIKKSAPEFVEANPYANDLKPADAAPTSFKNQRAADEIPDKTSTSPRPAVKGEDKKYKKIVSGTSDELDRLDPARITRVLERPLSEPQTQAPQKPAAQAAANPSAARRANENQPAAQAANSAAKAKGAAQEASAQPAEKPALARAETGVKTPAKPDEIDAAVADSDPNAIIVPKAAPEPAKAQKNPPKTADDATRKTAAMQPESARQPAAQAPAMPINPDIPAPRARPRLSMKIPAGPLMDNNRAASQAGVVAVDSRFSEFGAYQQRMIEAISRQWNLLGGKYDLSAEIGASVLIEFSLNTEGELVNFKVAATSASNVGTGLCEQSILSTAPYGVWTQEMVNTLGQQPQQVRINFIYR